MQYSGVAEVAKTFGCIVQTFAAWTERPKLLTSFATECGTLGSGSRQDFRRRNLKDRNSGEFRYRMVPLQNA